MNDFDTKVLLLIHCLITPTDLTVELLDRDDTVYQNIYFKNAWI